MAGFALTEFIQAPPNEVFDFLLDVDQAHQVVPAIKKTEKLDEFPVKVGTRFSQTRVHGGKEIISEYEVLELEPRQHFTVASQRSGVRATYEYSMHPDAGGTVLQLRCEVEGEGIKRPLAWLVAEAMRRENDGLLLKLRRVLETNHKETENQNSS